MFFDLQKTDLHKAQFYKANQFKKLIFLQTRTDLSSRGSMKIYFSGSNAQKDTLAVAKALLEGFVL